MFEFFQLPPLSAVTPLLLAVIVTALIFDFVNGWNDSANAIATVVGTKVLTPFQAVFLASVFNLLGALVSVKIAKTMTMGLLDSTLITESVILATFLAAIVWATLMTLWGMPISGTHCLVGALFGAGVGKAGVGVIKPLGLLKVFLAIFTSPIAGFMCGFAICWLIRYLFSAVTPKAGERWFGGLQILSASAMAFSHGQADAQKVMGVITIALLSAGATPAGLEQNFMVPLWVKLACAVAIGIGTAAGGWGVIKTLGHDLAVLRSYHGFAAELGASGVLSVMAFLGVPVSTTHTITGAIMGVGATQGKSGVKWGLGRKIMLAWVFTLPVCTSLGGLFYWILFSFKFV